jgi:hypothetical protein|tara:strand:- start:367 stop:615 length:249 start_codon:yes stop_codon:yes gene_type:complete
MKTLHNIWELTQLSNHTLKEIGFELDLHLYGECPINYNYMNKTELVGSICNTLFEEGCDDETTMIDYLLELVKECKITLTNH